MRTCQTGWLSFKLHHVNCAVTVKAANPARLPRATRFPPGINTGLLHQMATSVPLAPAGEPFCSKAPWHPPPVKLTPQRDYYPCNQAELVIGGKSIHKQNSHQKTSFLAQLGGQCFSQSLTLSCCLGRCVSLGPVVVQLIFSVASVKREALHSR